jgi:hypothetical protein
LRRFAAEATHHASSDRGASNLNWGLGKPGPHVFSWVISKVIYRVNSSATKGRLKL